MPAQPIVQSRTAQRVSGAATVNMVNRQEGWVSLTTQLATTSVSINHLQLQPVQLCGMLGDAN